MLKYDVKLNNGVEALNINEKSVSVEERVENVDAAFLAHHMHLHNGLIPEGVATEVLNLFCETAAELMGQGYAVVLKSKGKAALRLYPDIHVKDGNINLARAQQLMPEVTELTVENAAELVQRAGVTVRPKAECEKGMAVLFDQSKSSLHLNEVVNVPYVARQSGSGSTTPTTPTTGGGDGEGGEFGN